METLSEQAIIEKIARRETFSATVDGGGFSLKIDRYEPAMSAAIHNGGNLRAELADTCLLSQSERYYEEDPFTGSFIEQQPITLIGNDSRYEYDLNRATDLCVYETAWGMLHKLRAAMVAPDRTLLTGTVEEMIKPYIV